MLRQKWFFMIFKFIIFLNSLWILEFSCQGYMSCMERYYTNANYYRGCLLRQFTLSMLLFCNIKNESINRRHENNYRNEVYQSWLSWDTYWKSIDLVLGSGMMPLSSWYYRKSTIWDRLGCWHEYLGRVVCELNYVKLTLWCCIYLFLMSSTLVSWTILCYCCSCFELLKIYL